jgi:RNA polymerase-binding transcription factor DksA
VWSDAAPSIEEDVMVNAAVVSHEPNALSASTLHRLRRRLSDERVSQLELAVALEEATAPGAAIAVEWELDAVLAAKVRDTLRDIVAALDRMDAGTYGWCESCGRPLPLERLEAMPSTRWCVSCSTVHRPLRHRGRA